MTILGKVAVIALTIILFGAITCRAQVTKVLPEAAGRYSLVALDSDGSAQPAAANATETDPPKPGRQAKIATGTSI